jgi:DNA polymerase-4
VGPATERALAAIGVTTVAELRALDAGALRRRFGRQGQWLHHASRGLDRRPVRIERIRKTLGHERTYSEDLGTLEAMDAELAELAARVAAGLERGTLLARTISIKVRYADFTTLTRSRTFDYPTASEALLCDVARDLLRRTDAGRRTVRLLGVTGSGLFERGEVPEQLTLL